MQPLPAAADKPNVCRSSVSLFYLSNQPIFHSSIPFQQIFLRVPRISFFIFSIRSCTWRIRASNKSPQATVTSPTASMPGVEGRRVLLSGGNRGIGMAAAKLFRERGAKVCIVARTEATLKTSGLAYVAADLSTRKGCSTAIKVATEQLGGPIDILVCNHGIGSAHEKPLHLTDIDEWKTSMDTNLIGPFYLTREVMPSMVEQRYGRIVYTASTAATEAEPQACGYNTSKAGLCGLMRSVAQDGGEYNVTSNAVLPGWVKTEMADRSAKAEAEARGRTPEEIWKERAALYPAKRVLTPEEVAHTILFLASEESSGISGESIRVSGGCPW